MITKELLQKFCSTKESDRYRIDKPWSRDGFTYATNGHIMARVPTLSDVSEDKDAPDAKDIFDKASAPIEWLPIPGDLPERNIQYCDRCGAAGKIYVQSVKKWEKCEECDNGKKEKAVKVKVGASYFDTKYLHMLKELPDCQISLPADNLMPAYFKFDGGDGLLMPMNL